MEHEFSNLVTPKHPTHRPNLLRTNNPTKSKITYSIFHYQTQYDLSQLDPMQITTLKTQLTQWITQPQIIIHASLRIQLALSIAALAIQDLSWQSPVLDILNQFNSDQYIMALLDCWMILPEEFSENTQIEQSVFFFEMVVYIRDK